MQDETEEANIINSEVNSINNNNNDNGDGKKYLMKIHWIIC